MDFLTWQKDRYRKREGHESVTRKSSEACEKKEAEPPRWDVRSTAASRHWAQNRWLEIKDWSGFLQPSSMCSFFPCSGGVGLLYILVILGNFNYKYPIINQLKTVQSQVSAVMLIQLFHPGEALIHPETLTLQDSNFSGYFKFNLISPLIGFIIMNLSDGRKQFLLLLGTCRKERACCGAFPAFSRLFWGCENV